MRKFLSLLVTMLCSVVAMAQDHWTYERNTYPDATVVYVKVNEGTPAPDPLDRYEIAAFVDGELRATTRTCRAGGTGTTSTYIYTLRVEGENVADNNKTIEFRLFDHTFGIEYELTQTFKYNGKETVSYPSNALSLTFNPFDGYINWGADDFYVPKGKTAKLPYKFMKYDNGAEVEVTDMSVYNKIVLPFEVNAGSPAYFSFNETDQRTVTGISKTPASAVGTISVSTTSNIIGTHTYNINVYEPLSGASFNTDKLIIPVSKGNDDYVELMDYLTIAPADLSSWFYEVSAWVGTGEEQYLDANNACAGQWFLFGEKPGNGTLHVKVTDANDPSVSYEISVPFEVVQPVTGITVNNVHNVYVGNAVDVTDWFTVAPNNATNPVVDVKCVDRAGTTVMGTVAYDATTKKYTLTPTQKGYAKLVITTKDGTNITNETGLFKVIQAVESITVKQETINMKEDDVINLTTGGYYTVNPADADDKSVTIEAQVYSDGRGAWVPTAGIKVEQGRDVTGAPNDEWILTGVSDGTYRIVITSENGVNGTEVTATINVVVGAKLRGIKLTYFSGDELLENGEILRMGTGLGLSIHSVPEGIELPNDKLSYELTTKHDYAPGWEYIKVNGISYNSSTKVNSLTVTGRAITNDHTLTVTYRDGNDVFSASVDFKVFQDIQYKKGWNWSQPFSGNQIAAANKNYSIESVFGYASGLTLSEIRTEDGVLINDPEWGYFGDVENILAPSRINVSKDWFEDYYCQPVAAANENLDVHKNWNWINYPYMYEHSISEIYAANCGASEGDIIKSQEEFATFTNGAWTGSLTTFKPGQSYAYYSTASKAVITRPAFNSLSQPADGRSAAPSREQSVWQYNPRQFADNMGMVAVVDELDFPEDYTIGAFVDDECRGEGKYVDGKWFITIHGEADELVSLKVLNTRTNEIADVEGKYLFDSMLGTVKSPIMLDLAPFKQGEATGIAVVGNSVIGNGARVFTLGGVEVTNNTLTPGVYVVKNGGKTTKVTIK